MTVVDAQALTEKALAELRHFQVSRVSREPLYLQAVRSIESILGLYATAMETPIPPETEMAAALGIGRPTIRQALSHLAQAGRIYTKRGIGTFLAPAVLSRPAKLTSLFDDLEARGLQPTTRVLEVATTTADDDAAADLGVEPGSPLTLIRRVRSASGKPLVIIENLLNLQDAPAPSAKDLERTGLYATLRARYGIELGMATLRVSARLATTYERTELHLPSPSAVLIARRLAFDTAGRGVEIGTTVYSEGAEIGNIRLQP